MQVSVGHNICRQLPAGTAHRKHPTKAPILPKHPLPKALAALQKGKKFTPESVSRLLEKISAGGYGDKRLSPKESEVLRLFAEGFLVTEIAKKLNRSIKTISSQKKSAMMKLGVENDIALLNYLSSVTLSPADKD